MISVYIHIGNTARRGQRSVHKVCVILHVSGCEEVYALLGFLNYSSFQCNGVLSRTALNVVYQGYPTRKGD